MLGDNRDDSYDSRYWGLVPAENVVGRPLLIYWSMDAVPPAHGQKAEPSGKLSTLAYSAIQSVKGLRWKRMFRIPSLDWRSRNSITAEREGAIGCHKKTQ